MTLDELKRVLTKAASFDPRMKVTPDVTMNWHDQLAGVGVAEALAAVSLWYGRTNDFLTVKNLKDAIREVRSEREEADIRRSNRPLGAPWRFCGRSGCVCTHTSCCHGILDELEEYVLPDGPFAGHTYKRATRCPQCEKARTSND